MKKNIFKIVLMLCFVILLVCVFYFGFVAYKIIMDMVEKEKCYQSALVVSVVLESYVDERNKWPLSWEEMQEVTPGRAAAGWPAWPSDILVIKQYVEVNFNLSVADIMQYDTDGNKDMFILRPTGKCIAAYTERIIEPLIFNIKNILLDKGFKSNSETESQ